MQAEDVRLLLDHDAWATERLLRAAEGMSAEEFAASPGSGHPPLGEVLWHIGAAQWAWLVRWQGASAELHPDDVPVHTVAEARSYLDTHRAALVRVLDRPAGDVAGRMTWRPDGSNDLVSLAPVALMLVHVVNHGTQHRSEAAATLTLLGRSPGDLDFDEFLWERGIISPAGAESGR